MSARIAVIEGDGIGREVIPAAVDILKDMGLGLDFEGYDVGAERFLRTGEALPQPMFEEIEAADAILLGAIGDPRITDPTYNTQTLRRLRRGLDLYANVRPAKLLDARVSPLRDTEGGVDIVVVRENTEGLYSSLGGRFKQGGPDELAIQEHLSTRRGVERILGHAFSLARRDVVMADKRNAMPHAGGLWQDCWRAACAAHPEIPARHLMIDACALHMIQHPAGFDVIVTENCFGDILSDVAGALIGGVGMAPSANVNTQTGMGMFEPGHGSAPDIAGKGIANPVAAMLTAALLLRHLGFAGEASKVEDAVGAAVRAGECTADIGGDLTTRQAAEAVARRIG
ncbi:MAG: isocitrate/isopropylmalate dehydrogenase family protein [Acidimicrobiales bacterium]